MKKKSFGFTLIEVSLFLAITGALFVSITAGVQNSIYQQRFNDSVQSFADFLRNIYSEVLNVQNIGGGRSDTVIYGKLVTFGEKEGDHRSRKIYAYNVVGNIGDNVGTGGTLELLKDLNADVVIREKTPEGGNKIKYSGIVEDFTPKWSSEIEPPCDDKGNCSYDQLIGALLIVRHPKSGTVYTYFKNGSTIDVQEAMGKVDPPLELLKPELSNFKLQQVDFCVNPVGDENTGFRRDVRIVQNARNSSGVEIVNDADSKCSKD